MQQRFACEALSGSLHSITRELAPAIRSLAKERAFTLVCIISLGIGMGAFVANGHLHSRDLCARFHDRRLRRTILAGLPAARRATSIQPMVAMRSE